MAARAAVGDVFEILLPDGRFAYCHYLLWSGRMGCLIRVFEKVTTAPRTLEELSREGELFPPVFAGLKAAVSDGRWKKVGKLPVPPFKHPTFRSCAAGRLQPGVYTNWWIWDGGERRFIGKLPPELRSLEVECGWGYELLEERIATGKNMFEGMH